MNITEPLARLEWVIQKIHSVVYKLENTGDTDIHHNGELRFIRDTVEALPDEFTFFDVGANTGDYTELVLQFLGTKKAKLHLFEPQKTCFATLENKFRNHQNIILNNFGLSNQTNTQTLYKNNDGSGLASLYQRNLGHYDIAMNMTEEVALRTAADYLTQNHVTKIDFMKIDVEGHEIDVLDGFGSFLRPENVNIIQFEYGGANLDSHTSLLDLFEYFTKRDFVICKVMRRSLELRKYHPRFENFMYSNWVALNPTLLTNF